MLNRTARKVSTGGVIVAGALFMLLMFNSGSLMANKISSEPAPSFELKTPAPNTNLDQLKTATENIKQNQDKADTFQAIAKSAAPIDNKDKILTYLEQAKTAAEHIQEQGAKARLFQALADAATTLGDKAQGLAYLEQAKTAAEHIQEQGAKASLFQALADVAATLGDKAQGLAYLEQYKTAMENIKQNQDKAETTTVCQFQSNAGPEMVLIAEGQFKMGSPENEPDRSNDESPQHTVKISKPFAISRCEVTIAEFKHFVEATGYKTDAEKGKGCYVWDAKASTWNQKIGTYWRSPGYVQQDNHPVACISWVDAKEYIKWLNDSLKLTNKTYRLPTEAEWEYTARAGTTSPYYWGNDSQCDYANGADSAMKDSKQYPADWPYANCTDKFVNTGPVGTFKANAWGLYDISGNVLEWVEDCYHDSYKGELGDGSAWQADKGECTYRSVRGGGWLGILSYLRSAYRSRYARDEAGSALGFRLARTL